MLMKGTGIGPTKKWREAAERWRDEYFNEIPKLK